MFFGKRGGIPAALLLCLSLHAVGGAILNQEKETPPTVNPTGSLLAIDSPGRNNAADTPRGMSAARLAVSGKVFEWTPSPDPGRVTGGADLIDALLSPDESLLVVLEKVGGKRTPSGCRILMFNLFNNKLVNAIFLSDTLPGPAVFLPDGTTLSMVRRAQEALNQPEQLMLFDLATGTRRLSIPLPSPVRGLAANASATWVTLAEGNRFLRFDHRDFEKKPTEIRTLIPNPGLALTADGKTLILFGAGRLEFFNAAGSATELLGSRQLPENFIPAWCVPVSADGRSLVMAAENGPAMLLAGSAFRELASKSGVPGSYRTDDRKFLLPIPFKESINLYTLPENVNPETTASPGRLRPFSSADNFRIFFCSGPEQEAILVDHRANISRLRIKAKRWEKSMIFEAP